jgi:hypothetical protein
MNGTLVSLEDADLMSSLPSLDDLDILDSSSDLADVEQAKTKYTGVMSSCVERLKEMAKRNKQSHMMPVYLDRVSQMVGKAWAVPAPHGQSLASSLCDVLRHDGGLDVLINNCVADDSNLQLSSARLLEQCLTQENREYVVECGLDKVNRHSSLFLSLSCQSLHGRFVAGLKLWDGLETSSGFFVDIFPISLRRSTVLDT